MRGLRDKVAIVAGAAPGNIGGATALRLAQEGMKVTAADFNEAAARAVVDQIKSAGGHAVARAFDITKEASYELTAQHKLTSTPHTTQSICVSQRRRTNPEPSQKNPLNLPKRATHNRGFAYNRDHSARAHGGLYAYAIVNDWIPGDHQSDLHRRAAEFNLHGHSIVSHADIWV